MNATKSKLCRGVAAIALVGVLTSCAAPSSTSNDITVTQLPDSNSDALMGVARTAEAEGDADTALGLYQRAAQASPGNIEPLMAAGRLAASNGKFDEAARAYQLVVQNDPANLDALYGLGRALAAQDLPNAARNHFEAMLKINRGDARAYNGMGIALDLLGDHRQAQSQYRTGLAIEADSISLRNNLAYSLILSGDHGEAVELLEQVVQSPGASKQSHRNLALAYSLMGREEDSQAVVLGGDGVDDMAQAVTSYQAGGAAADSTTEGAPQPLAASQNSAAGANAVSAAATAPAAAYGVAEPNNGPHTITMVEETISFEADPEGPAAETRVSYSRQSEPSEVTPRFVSAPAAGTPEDFGLNDGDLEDGDLEEGGLENDVAKEVGVEQPGSEETGSKEADLEAPEDQAQDTAEVGATQSVPDQAEEPAIGGLEAQAAVKRPSAEERRIVSYEQSEPQTVNYSLSDTPSLSDRAAAEGINDQPSLKDRFLINE